MNKFNQNCNTQKKDFKLIRRLLRQDPFYDLEILHKTSNKSSKTKKRGFFLGMGSTL